MGRAFKINQSKRFGKKSTVKFKTQTFNKIQLCYFPIKVDWIEIKAPFTWLFMVLEINAIRIDILKMK